MSAPPPGYDDETIVPQKRLSLLLGQVESELNQISQVFRQHLPGQFKTAPKIEIELRSLRASAEELGTEYLFLVEKLIKDYEHFRNTPDQQKLDQIFSDVKSLQLLLVG